MSAERGLGRVYVGLVFQTLIGAGTYIVAKPALGIVPPLALGMVRFLGAGVAFAVVLWATGRLRAPPREALPRVFLLGLLGVPLNQGLFLEGLSRTTPVHTALLYALTPLLVLAMAWISGTERPGPMRIAGMLLAPSGGALVILHRTPGGDGGSFAGDLLILAAVCSWAAYTVLGRDLIRRHGTVEATAWTIMAGTLLFLPVGLPETVHAGAGAFTPPVWGALAYLVILTSVVSYLLWYHALGRIGPSRAAVFGNLQPVAASFLSWLLLGETITADLVAGGALVVCGVLLATRETPAAAPMAPEVP